MAPPAREQLLLLQIVPGPGRAARHGLNHSGLASQPERCSHSSGSDRNTAAGERGNGAPTEPGRAAEPEPQYERVVGLSERLEEAHSLLWDSPRQNVVRESKLCYPGGL